MDVKIIVNIFYPLVSQLKTLLENNDVYVPVNGGSTLKDDSWMKDHSFFDDDFDGNMSSHNNKLNEMTSIWWAWKNLNRFGKIDYIGFNHYRRFFDTNDINDDNIDIFVAQTIKCPISLAQQYCIYHVKSDLKLCLHIVDELYSHNIAQSLLNYLTSYTDNFAPMNMFVMRKKLFVEWCEFIFPILFELEKQIDVTGRDNYQKRAICFLCERIFGWWCFNKQQTLHVMQLKVIEHLDFKNNNLNERGTY